MDGLQTILYHAIQSCTRINLINNAVKKHIYCWNKTDLCTIRKSLNSHALAICIHTIVPEVTKVTRQNNSYWPCHIEVLLFLSDFVAAHPLHHLLLPLCCLPRRSLDVEGGLCQESCWCLSAFFGCLTTQSESICATGVTNYGCLEVVGHQLWSFRRGQQLWSFRRIVGDDDGSWSGWLRMEEEWLKCGAIWLLALHVKLIAHCTPLLFFLIILLMLLNQKSVNTL